jgi:hypothetical protein
MEAAAALDTMRVMTLIDDSRFERGIDLFEGIVAMLTKMTWPVDDNAEGGVDVQVHVEVDVKVNAN